MSGQYLALPYYPPQTDPYAEASDDVLACVLEHAPVIEEQSEWPKPESIAVALPEVPVFDPELLPVSLRPLVEDVADRMQVPVDFPAVVTVATLAGLCGRRALVQPKAQDSSWIVTPNLWGALIGPPSVMKSPIIACITATAKAIEGEWRDAHKDAVTEYESAQERAQLDHSVWAEQYKRAAKQGRPAPIQPESSLTPPTQRRLIAVDATAESLHERLAENPGGIFVLRDELSGWLAGLERQGREQERAFFLECWNGDSNFMVDRIGRGQICVEHCCVSLFGGIQPDRLQAYLADALRNGPSNDGLIQRFQLCVWPDLPRTWKYVDRTPDATALRMADAVYRRLVGMNPETPLLLKFSADAQSLFVEWLTGLEAQLRGGEISPFIQAHLAKYRKLMPAIALLLSLADGSLDEVGLRHAQQAAAWCGYLEHHAHRIYASRTSPGVMAAGDLAKKLMKGWRRNEGEFSVRDVYRNAWTGLATPDEARAALLLLEDAGWVRRSTAPSTSGRPSEIYLLNPRIGDRNVGH
jgi:hypothetical protein